MNKKFWLPFMIFSLVCGLVLQVTSVFEIGYPALRPAIPIPWRQYVSATRDGQTDQYLFYGNLFGFGDRLAKANVLAAGSSHVEFGINASLVASALKSHSDDERAFNMGLGGGEGIDFAVILLKKYNVHPALLVVDPFATTIGGPSVEAKNAMAMTRGEAYRRVFDIWAGFARDWLLEGLLPRTTLSIDGIKLEQPIGTTIIRNWQTADVTAVYSDRGEIYRDPSKGHPMQAGPNWPGNVPLPADLQALKNVAKATLVTSIPYPAYKDTIARDMAGAIGAMYVPLSPDGLLFWDYHHLDLESRDRISLQLAGAIPP